MPDAPGVPAPRRRRSARRDQGPPAPIQNMPDPSEQPSERPVPPVESETDDRAGRLRKRPRRRTGASPMLVGRAPEQTPEHAHAHEAPPPARDRRSDPSERALRGLVTTRGTQVDWSAATRAREVAAPTAADLAEAEAEVVVVRRNYTPPEPLPQARTSGEVTSRPRRGGR